MGLGSGTGGFVYRQLGPKDAVFDHFLELLGNHQPTLQAQRQATHPRHLVLLVLTVVTSILSWYSTLQIGGMV